MPTPEEIIEEFTARRSVNLERRLEDETDATDAIVRAMDVYKCGLRPEIDARGAFVRMQAYAQGQHNSPETLKNLQAFTEYVMKVKEEYRIEFFPIQVEKEDGTVELQEVLPMVTW